MSSESDLRQKAFDEPRSSLTITLHFAAGFIHLKWCSLPASEMEAEAQVRCTGRNQITWTLKLTSEELVRESSTHRTSIRAVINRLASMFNVSQVVACAIHADKGLPAGRWEAVQVPNAAYWCDWLEDAVCDMAKQLAFNFPPAEKWLREEITKNRKSAHTSKKPNNSKPKQEVAATLPPSPRRPPPPPVAVDVTLPERPAAWTTQILQSLNDYFVLERAASWWVSNQTDTLLALPYCKIERLDYQIRTALKAIGPLRGRALLSDEVGLGKTIEAGLILKEYLIRGMARRFLVLTTPSLVDQWAEELQDKFGLACATTNEPRFRSNPAQFWSAESAIVASLHTVKQEAHLAVAQTQTWDILIVDEAHYLRNRSSLAWQAINALPRQFLLLLTATPVQNSLEEVYNLVTLLQPGQLPPPKEFRARFLDPDKPHQPKEPEELRRLLGQVMIRNTRASAGINLPPRRAETIVFERSQPECDFWQQWEIQLRAELANLPASQASLWGRLLLQAASSSPAAWKDALKSFPNRAVADNWVAQAEQCCDSWKQRCELLLPAAKGEGGVVIFTQFLWTQAALAQTLRAQSVPVWVMHGQIPAAERQPIIEEFRNRGGALLLTQSGTEGRNLQFCRRLINFDLPWNPMQIEQRIGRLHRIGQQHPVSIYNFVLAGTLQEHLLAILQDKLNLFELVVGETGLILGDRFTSDEFAEEIFRRWQQSEGRVAESLAQLGDELAEARQKHAEVKQLDESLFAQNYETV